MDTAELRRLAEAASGGPWRACHEGKCKCGQVWTEVGDHPVCVVERGEWGDTWPAIRFVDGEGMQGTKVETYMEKIAYGSISEELAQANVAHIAAFHPARILAMLDVIEAARRFVELDCANNPSPDEWNAGFDATAAALAQLDATP